MKLFILLAILFFSWRVFSQSYDYYYVDEYIRAQEDPDYLKVLAERVKEESQMKQSAAEYKTQKEYESYLHEQARQKYVQNRDLQPGESNQEKLEKEYELQKQKEFAEQEKMKEQYLREQELLAEKKQELFPKRQIASVLPQEEHHRVPKDKRKYHFKSHPRFSPNK